jgi:GNAT superfamily N-acetyltransferase
MNNAATAKAARHPWRSVGAVLAGLIFIVVTHLGTDTIMNPTDSIAIREANNSAEVGMVRELLLEYQQALGIDLGFQGFAAELENPPGEYAPPRGRLLLARVADNVAGCVALRPLSGDACEMKRLYVRPAYRALSVGRQLAECVIAEARAAGYRRSHKPQTPALPGQCAHILDGSPRDCAFDFVADPE